MKRKTIILAVAAMALVACQSKDMKPQQGYIGPSNIQIQDGIMTPEALLSLEDEARCPA